MFPAHGKDASSRARIGARTTPPVLIASPWWNWP